MNRDDRPLGSVANKLLLQPGSVFFVPPGAAAAQALDLPGRGSL